MYNGNPFLDDIKNEEYISNKLYEIKNDVKDDKLIIIENFSNIEPYLFDLYNRNYQIIKGEKYAKLNLGIFNQQLIKVNDNLRIIILVDENSMEKIDSTLLNRFEKLIFSFDHLFDNQLKIIYNNLIEEIGLRRNIRQIENNHCLMNLLTSCENIEIKGLIYYFCKIKKKNLNELDNIDEEQLKENIIKKIYKILPQDIIDILPEDNILKIKYNKNKRIYNFKDYISNEELKKYKISIIYTFSSIFDNVYCLNKKLSFSISDIKSEDEIINLINELKRINQTDDENENYICIYFNSSESININYMINFILNNSTDDQYNYILIICIDKYLDDEIYLHIDINPNIYQIFIDNLNGKKF